MSRAGIWVLAGWAVFVPVWAWFHHGFNGASILVIAICLLSAWVLWVDETRHRPSDLPVCPHCHEPLGPWLDPTKKRGDGI